MTDNQPLILICARLSGLAGRVRGRWHATARLDDATGDSLGHASVTLAPPGATEVEASAESDDDAQSPPPATLLAAHALRRDLLAAAAHLRDAAGAELATLSSNTIKTLRTAPDAAVLPPLDLAPALTEALAASPQRLPAAATWSVALDARRARSGMLSASVIAHILSGGEGRRSLVPQSDLPGLADALRAWLSDAEPWLVGVQRLRLSWRLHPCPAAGAPRFDPRRSRIDAFLRQLANVGAMSGVALLIGNDGVLRATVPSGRPVGAYAWDPPSGRLHGLKAPPGR